MSNQPFNCLVCQSQITSTRLGIEACRACASFFKRTVVCRKVYVCRQGNQQCDLSKKMCRRCRYEKCLDVKMDIGLKKIMGEDLLIPNIVKIIPSSSPSTQTLLQKISREYKLCVDRRRKAEEILRLTEYPELKRIPHPTMSLYMCSVKFEADSFRITARGINEFVIKSFPDFGTLSTTHQNLLMKSFVAPFSLIESYYLTIQNDTSMRYFMISLTTCMDLEDYESNNFSEDLKEKGMKNDLYGTMEHYMRQSMSLTLPSLQKANLTMTEYHALISLSMWSLDHNQSFPTVIHRIADKIRNEIFVDLHRYYKDELGLTDYSVKMGNLMSVMHTMKEATALFQEEIRMYITIFELQSDDDFLREIF